MKWITAGDLKYWYNAKRRHCEETLPELVRRLISATADSVQKLDFPSGDSVTTEGWDGYLETAAVGQPFPTGVSGWEMGIENTPGKKADSAYKARTQDPRGVDKESATFVFVTPRPWPKRRQWALNKRRSRTWKAVEVIAASELEQWLEAAPAVALWLAIQIGKAPEGVRDLEAVWDEWSSATTRPLSEAVVCAGRDEEVRQVHEWLAGTPDIFEVQGDSPDEVAPFLFAAISRLEESAKTRALARCVVVEDISQFRSCAQLSSPLVIVAPAQCREAANSAVHRGHHVYLIADSNSLDLQGRSVTLSRPIRPVLEEALRKSGWTEPDAERYARDSGASVPVLRRLIFPSSVSVPFWAGPDYRERLLPAMLVGAWREENRADREVIERLSARNYDEFARDLEPLVQADDSPFRRVGGVWMLKSPLVTWFFLSRYLRTEHLQRLDREVLEVFLFVDPKYELEPDKQFAAAVFGKGRRYSGWLEEGLVKSLVLLGVHGGADSPRLGQQFADAVVRGVLTNLTGWQGWASLKGVLPLLAEASPESFLDVLDTRVRNEPGTFVEILKDDGTAFGECRHAGLLWAIEGLAWQPDYLSPAVKALAALARVDPGGKWSNRPVNSLRDIFLPQVPQTYATPQTRVEVFDALSAEDPELAWRIGQGLVSGGHLTASHQFRWRPYPDSRAPLDRESPEATREYAPGLLARLNELVGASTSNLINAITHFPSLGAVREGVLQAIRTVDPADLSRDELDDLLSGLRNALHHINTYGRPSDKAQGKELAAALERLAPRDPLERDSWLLGEAWPHLPEGQPKDIAKSEEAITARRQDAARQVLESSPLERIADWGAGATVKYAGVFGDAFGRVITDDATDAAFLDLLLARVPRNEMLILGYCVGRIAVTGGKWVTEQAKRLQREGVWSPEAVALLFLALPNEPSTWRDIASHGAAAERAYWERVNPYAAASADPSMALEKLLDADRPDAALVVAGNPNRSLPSSMLQRLLQALLRFEPKTGQVDDTMFHYHLNRVFKQLHSRPEVALEDLARLEWPFSQLLCDQVGEDTVQGLALHRILARDAKFFVELVSYCYRRDDGQVEASVDNLTDAQRSSRTDNARAVLNTWRTLPGLTADGAVDGAVLTDWVMAARARCAEACLVTAGDLQIAEMLARTPPDPDGAWPHRGVRDLIERLGNQTIDEHIGIAIRNTRSVTTRGPYDGGGLERAEAKRYERMASQLALRWPRTARILRELAKVYRAEARYEDISTDLRDLGGG